MTEDIPSFIKRTTYEEARRMAKFWRKYWWDWYMMVKLNPPKNIAKMAGGGKTGKRMIERYTTITDQITDELIEAYVPGYKERGIEETIQKLEPYRWHG